MKYRVMIAGYAGMPAIEASEHRWRWTAQLAAWAFNAMWAFKTCSPPVTLAFVQEVHQ
ncbi:hypothetical protein [Pseudoxanthomonas winnipegensis]|uniref:hypothetical protein n=1 Tax=Pseudoxanthomonas winnipegensis TaxID=2480810 RepID=UPI0013EE839A|nr:hypothetical protein [Pseudoxanthomonas winnipegensis]